MSHDKSTATHPPSGTRPRDPLDEVRKAVSADRRKIACVPVGALELKARPSAR